MSNFIWKKTSRAIPSISATEQIALQAGVSGWERSIFAGSPDWSALMATPRPELSDEARQFIEQKVPVLTAALSDWELVVNGGLTQNAWQTLKDSQVFGMIIPKNWGGLAFDAFDRAQVVSALSAASPALGVVAMVPNSLGPGELLLKYGTKTQQERWLPKLASGKLIPCFGLTSPWAGSDAAGIPDEAIVFSQTQTDGSVIYKAKLNATKRYITLAPVADLIGIAFQLKDPENLLGKGTEPGITLALFEKNHPNLTTGPSHMPLDALFPNGMVIAKDLVFNLDEHIIGGVANAGQGWLHLMDCLAEGRAISLPSSCLGSAYAAATFTEGYARSRMAFNMPLISMQGPRSRIAQIASDLLSITAVRDFAAAQVKKYHKPVVIGAFAKRYTTEKSRSSLLLAMDVCAGKAICMGPSNPLSKLWLNTPIGITVEGANSLTRDLILFNQGVIRSHPHLLTLMQSASKAKVEPDENTKLYKAQFHQSLLGMISHAGTNYAFSALGLPFSQHSNLDLKSLTHCHASFNRPLYKQALRAHAKLTRLFAACCDLALLRGKALRAEQMQSGRLADALEGLLATSAVLWRFAPYDYTASTEIGLEAALRITIATELKKSSESMEAFLKNHPHALAKTLAKTSCAGKTLFPLPKDALFLSAADWINGPSESFASIHNDLGSGLDLNGPISKAQQASHLWRSLWPSIPHQLRQAVSMGQLPHELLKKDFDQQVELAFEQGIVDPSVYEQFKQAYVLSEELLHVDAFENTSVFARPELAKLYDFDTQRPDR